MMKYKGTFIKLFPIFMRKYLNEQYGKDVTSEALKKAPGIYRDMLAKVDDIGADNEQLISRIEFGNAIASML